MNIGINIVLIVAVLIVLASAFIGFGRGLIKSVFSTFALIVAIVLALQIMPYGTKFLKTTPLYTNINDSIQYVFFNFVIIPSILLFRKMIFQSTKYLLKIFL